MHAHDISLYINRVLLRLSIFVCCYGNLKFHRLIGKVEISNFAVSLGINDFTEMYKLPVNFVQIAENMFLYNVWEWPMLAL